ncbi:peptide-methionine (R)-S-oxide reductase MsrB [Pseudohoeflea coraliihabitans]|uniref:Peptide-methionine (R)-S-oxide reductase MsrB n=1 Tax=Pseudohoeflea coraliihabitans TaxID=2860393 RepID=A0ABS6WLM0_9HYPH|nr:peptide-methionine (R)-S-oxide reductase MsrB [Pseudohoeflea sp. DP4N28-3]MBW3096862.1 peptide-methionine (R)-S-oxide reductase MsrB [Pseudohoeflea sp. DP4N28-3]
MTNPSFNRRKLLLAGAATMAGVATVGIAAMLRPDGHRARAETAGDFEISLSEAEWRQRLTAEEFRILREEGTERAFSSPLDKNYKPGIYHCAGCDLPVYSSEAKYDSGTGWPSFYQSLPDAIGTKDDRSLFALRTEVHCRRCGGHFGHIFDDGPAPTGLRHCLNGVALRFAPQAA